MHRMQKRRHVQPVPAQNRRHAAFPQAVPREAPGRLPCPVASPPLNGCRCVPGPQPVHTARPVHTPTRQQKAKVYALPLYAESAPCNRKSHPACMRGGQSANTLQTRCKQQALRSYPQTIPGNRAEIEKMPALKGFRRCPSAHQMRQLTSYADGFDGPERDWKPEGPRAKACICHGEAAGVHAENPR